MTARKLVLENKMGQRVRSFQVEASESNLVYRQDTRRVELHTDLSLLDEAGVEYSVIKKISVSSLEKRDLKIAELGTLRLAEEVETVKASPQYELPEEEEKERMALLLKKTAIGHGAAIAVLILVSIAVNYFTAKEEPTLVTIVMPEAPKPIVKEKIQKVKVSEKKIVQQKTKIKKVSNKTVIKPVAPKHAVNRKAPTPVVRREKIVVRGERQQNLNNVGALAALGGLKNGTRGYEGLDANSLKKIRSAGVGSGGGGVGQGSGGVRGVMPGTGLIAGSQGSGGRAEGAGGYGTKGQGGGRAGYGKISMVGSTSGISLPIDEEASVEGGLDKDQIAAVINRKKGEIIYCYEQGLQNESSDLRGRVTMDFVIGGNGRVRTASVGQSSLGSDSVENCMLRKLKGWQFPRPVGNVNVDVSYPFELKRVAGR